MRPTRPAKRTRSAGGCDFERDLDLDVPSARVPWTAAALPTVTAVASAPPELTNTALGLAFDASLARSLATPGGVEMTAEGLTLRVFTLDAAAALENAIPAVVLPLDAAFESRVRAAERLWRALRGRPPGRDPSPLPLARRRRLVRAVQALDAHQARASYREVAQVVFGAERVGTVGWKTDPLRDQAIRLTRLGTGLVRGGYRHLLLHPFRRRGG